MNRPPDSKGFRQPIRESADSRFGGGENGTGADSAEDIMVREPVQRRKEWERSRRCGWEIDLGDDTAAARLVREPILRKEQWFQEPISTVSQ